MCIRDSCEPVASDAALEYHAANSALTSMVKLVVCRVAPAAGSNWNVAVFISSVVEAPATVTWMPVDVVVTVTLLITGAAPAMVVVADGDVYKRQVFASAIGLFTLGSFLCGISKDIHVLVACRILQGCGGAMMVPVGRLTLVRTFPKSELVRTMSFVAIPSLVAPMLGPIAGGLIVGYLHWRVIFFVNIPIGLVGLLMVYLHLPDYREEHIHPLDVPGFLLFGSGIGLLSYVLEVFGEHTLSTAEILAMLAVSAVLLTAYGFRATKNPHPLLPLKLFCICLLYTSRCV